MKSHHSRSDFWQGYRDCSPFILVVAPFGLLFGVVATEAGLNLIETMTMASLVIAGAAQFTALALLEEQAPTFIVVIAALAVNLRMAVYSAGLVPHLGKASLGIRLLASFFLVDQNFAVALKKYESDSNLTILQKVAYYFGCTLAICPFWVGFTLLGALIGQSIPKEFSLDFAIPICFIALTAPMLKSLPHMVSALVSICVALLLAWMPYNLWLIVAAIVAMMAGAKTELLIQTKQTRPS